MAQFLCPATYTRLLGNMLSLSTGNSGSNKEKHYIVTGDIGGTNSRMSFYDAASDEPVVVKYYRNQDSFSSDSRIDPNDPSIFTKAVLIPFLEYCFQSRQQLDKEAPIIACLATAGFVSDNRVNMTNLNNLLVDGNYIQCAKDQQEDVSYLRNIVLCRVINDFVAQGYGCLTLAPDELVHLSGPKDIPPLEHGGVKVCVGAGTGLGECFLTPFPSTSGTSYACFPSEGGHVEYAPRNDLEVKLWKYLSQKFASANRISVERVVSGIGLANVYEFLTQEFPERVVDKIHKQFLKAGDEQGKVVALNATEKSLCLEALTMMMGAYGCEVGSAAIKWIPTGGLFVTGGLTPKNLKHIQGKDSAFLAAYHNKGRVSAILERIPLFAVQVEDLGVRGAHKAAVLAYEEYISSGKTASSAANQKGHSHGWMSMAMATVAGVAMGVMLTRRNKS